MGKTQSQQEKADGRRRKDGKLDGRGTALPEFLQAGAVASALWLLEILYDNKWHRIDSLANKTVLMPQTVRRVLEDMVDQKWIEKQRVGTAYHYHIAPKALLRPAQAAINHINELLEDNSNDETK